MKLIYLLFGLVEIEAISDINEKEKKLCKKYNIKKFYSSYKNLILNKSIDAVLICSPTNLHFKQIMFAAKHNKDIFCEKPVDLSLEKTEEILNIINKNKIKFMIGFNRRFDNSHKKLQQSCEKGVIGRKEMIIITSRDPNSPSYNILN